MRRIITILSVAALLVALAAAASPAGAALPSHETVVSFPAAPWGSFAEGMAADSHGALYVSLTTWGYADETTADPNVGEVWRVTRSGAKVVVREDLSPYGMLLGVAVDRADRVYVAVYDMGMGTIGNGVFRVDDGGLTQVVRLPEGAWPNGMAFHGRKLYITDSANGAIWRVRLGDGIAAPARPWDRDGLLMPAGPYGIGANGIAFLGDELYVSVSDKGRIVRIPVRADGTAGAAQSFAQTPALKSVDGIAFDPDGGLWVTVNRGSTGASPSGALYRLSRSAALTTIADDPGWLNYPTQPVFGTTSSSAWSLFVENGAYFSAYGDGTTPDVQALESVALDARAR